MRGDIAREVLERAETLRDLALRGEVVMVHLERKDAVAFDPMGWFTASSPASTITTVPMREWVPATMVDVSVRSMAHNRTCHEVVVEFILAAKLVPGAGDRYKDVHHSGRGHVEGQHVRRLTAAELLVADD